MPKFDFYPSFNAGEVSPLIDARTSLEKYKSACRIMENFQILPYGGAVRRPGMQFIGLAKNSSSRCRLIGFNFSTTTRFIIEIGVGYMRVWNGTSQVLSGTAPLELATPYLESELREVQFTQINDIMYFAHANHAVYKLSRVSDVSWTFAEVVWAYPPVRDVNTSATQISVNGATGNITVTATSSIFDAGHVGSQWRLDWKRTSGVLETPISAVKISDAIDITGAWDIQTYGTWTATIRVLRIPTEIWKNGPITASATRVTTVATVTHTAHGYSNGDLIHVTIGAAPFATTVPVAITYVGVNTYTYTVANSGATAATPITVENVTQMEVVREYDSNADLNITASGVEYDRVGLKIYVVAWTSGTNARATLTTSKFITGGQIRITAVASGTSASATVEEWLGRDSASSKKTQYWYEGAFSTYRGFPRAVAMHEQRLCFGAVTASPTTLWCSQIDDFENFEIGSNAADAISFTLSASEGNRINWMYSQSKLLVGTSGDEWTIGSSDAAQSISASNVQANRQSSYGSKYMRAAMVNDVLLFIQRNGRKVRELVYSLNKDGWVAPDLTLLAEHITIGQITDVAYQQQPDAILWCVRGDGALIAMTYERDQQVVGWHRHVTDGVVESVATVYGNGTEDEVWMVVYRTIDGYPKRYIERFQLLWRTYLDSSTTDSWRYLDSYVDAPPGSFAVSSVASRTVEIGASLEIVLNDSLFTLELAAGDIVTISGVVGTTQINRQCKLQTPTGVTHGAYWVLADPATNLPIDADGFTAYTSGGTAVFQNLYSAPTLSGKSVTVYKTGGVTETVTATSGRIPCTSQPLAVGLPYTSTLRPMKLDMEFPDGSSQGRKKRVHQIVVRTHKSQGGQVRTNAGDWFDLASTLTTGDQKIVLAGAFGIDADIDVRQTAPYPFCLIAVEPKWDAFGNE